MQRISEDTLRQFEKEHEAGLSSTQILGFLAEQGIKFSEATLRKYVQLGLLPRSVRVGRKGKHQGSQGIYPVSVVRQIQRIKSMMAADYTIEEIQRQFLFVRGDIEELERTLSKVLKSLREAAKKQPSETSGRAIQSELGSVETLAKDLVAKLNIIEQRLTAQAELSKKVAM